MCGIAGFVGQGSRDDIARMNAAQAWRGPDGSGVWSDPMHGVHLGHVRLAIIDLEGGRTADVDARWRDRSRLQRRDLQPRRIARGTQGRWCGNSSTDHSDTEVLLHGYRLWGDDFVNRLNGMWAFVIYDRPRRRLFASRDRFGKKPFYYTHQAWAVRVRLGAHGATCAPVRSMRSISTHGAPQVLCLRLHPGAQQHPVEGIHKLPGGHCSDFDVATGATASVEVLGFRDRAVRRHSSGRGRASGAKSCARLLAPRGQAPADVGRAHRVVSERRHRFVRGRVLRCTRTRTDRLNTYSIGFEEPTFDESAYAQRAADLRRQRHHSSEVSRSMQHDACVPEVFEPPGRADGRQFAAAHLSAVWIRARARNGCARGRRRRRALCRLRSVSRAALGGSLPEAGSATDAPGDFAC